MDMRRRIYVVVAVLLVVALALSACGNGGTGTPAEDLTAGVAPLEVSYTEPSENEIAAVADFSVKLFQLSADAEKNSLISPLSVLYALGMTMNGASGETLAQMEGLLGLSEAEMLNFAQSYAGGLPSGEKYQFSLANSIWFKDDETLSVNPDFLETNVSYYGADIYQAAFDKGTVKTINNWVSENTGGMIEEIVEEIPAETVMYLINALAFDAEWQQVYDKRQLAEGAFIVGPGLSNKVEMMYGDENVYLEDDSAVGFIKFYGDGRYAFAALLPNEDLSMTDYIASLSGEGLLNILNNAQQVKVSTAIPKFRSDYTLEMNGILAAMGMIDAFDQSQADFSRLGSSEQGNLFVSQVLHKTYIKLDELGTKAGAVTSVEVDVTSAPDSAAKKVHLNRPFVYMIIDCETNLPLFMGVMLEAGKPDIGA
jgi:serine protease inhibitor